MTKTKGFTLAEVLITLTIIGVIAALTIPTLLSKNQDQKTVSAVLKAYSVLKNAYEVSVVNNGPIEEWQIIGKSIPDVLSEQLKIVKTCTKASDGCMAISKQKSLNGQSDYWDSMGTKSYLLEDGSAFSYLAHSSTCEHNNHINALGKNINCGRIYFDINGAAKPNVMGKDIFAFSVDIDGIYAEDPVGDPTRTKSGGGTITNPLKLCNTNYSDIWNGTGCTDWILKMKNVDYLHCTGLNYDNPKCK